MKLLSIFVCLLGFCSAVSDLDAIQATMLRLEYILQEKCGPLLEGKLPKTDAVDSLNLKEFKTELNDLKEQLSNLQEEFETHKRDIEIQIDVVKTVGQQILPNIQKQFVDLKKAVDRDLQKITKKFNLQYPKVPPENCTEGKFLCIKSGQCISSGWVCDGDVDCPGREDEEFCEDYRCHGSGKCAKVYNQNDYWSDAKRECEKHNANLVIIENEEYNQFVSDLAHPFRGSGWDYTVVWIGLSQHGNEEYKWVNGEALGSYRPWNDTEESDTNTYDDQNHVALQTNTAKWLDAVGQNNWYFVCEKKRDNLQKNIEDITQLLI